MNDTSKSNGKIRRKSIVPKLKECTSIDRKNTELYITEGNSAAGSVIQTRDVKHQAVFPIRGKILNVAKGFKLLDSLKNEEAKGIVNAIGAGISDNCNADNSRYERIIISADSDYDGYHIQSLLASLFINLLPDLVKKGMVYALVSPLYGWTEKNGKMNFTNDQEIALKHKDFTRFKGLGEMDKDEFYEANMDPENRKLIRITYPEDLNEFNQIMTESSVKKDMLEQLGLINVREYKEES